MQQFFWVLFLTALAFAAARTTFQSRCREGEVYDECGSLCPRTCASPNLPSACPLICIPGCRCRDGFVQDSTGSCISPSFCPASSPVPTFPPFSPSPKFLPSDQTLAPTPSTTPKVTFCLGLADGKYASPEEDCAQIFYFCEAGEATQMQCSRGTYFDAVSGDCLYRNFVKACGGVATPKPKVTISPPRNPPFAFDCSDKKDGNFEHPTEACSPLWVSCSGGQAEYLECQSGLAFDVVSNKCLETAFVPWCPGGVATPEPKPAPPADATVPPFEFDCWAKADGDYPHPSNPCTHEYVSCVGREPTYRECGGQLKFDKDSRLCLLSAHVSSCGGSATPFPKTPTPTLPPTGSSGIAVDCSGGRPDGDYPHPSDVCSEFYWSCSGGVSRLRFCPQPLKFDALSMECQEEIYVENCGGVPTPKPKTPAPAPSNPPFDFDCSTKIDGDYDHPSNPCSQEYVSCSGGMAAFKECPGSLVFDWDTVRCLDSAYVAGCGGQPTPPQEEDQTPKPKIDFICSGLADGYYPNPTEPCNEKFYSCVGGEAMRMYCPGSLAWDIESGDCVQREYVQVCGGSSTPKTPAPKSSPPPPPADVSPLCAGKVPGNYELEEGQCSQKYVICSVMEEALETECGSGLYFDGESGQCLWRRNVKTCGGAPYVPKTPSPLPPSPTLPPKKQVGSCANLPNGVYGERCSKNFFFCVEGHTEARVCTGATYFNGLNRCVLSTTLKC